MTGFIMWRRWQPALLTGAVLLPVLAALGLLSMAREIAWEVSALPPPPSGRTAQTVAASARCRSHLSLPKSWESTT